jgi:hypothetical protein
MAGGQKRRTQASEKLVRALAAQTGVTPDQIRIIITLVGFDRAAILREVHRLKSQEDG